MSWRRTIRHLYEVKTSAAVIIFLFLATYASACSMNACLGRGEEFGPNFVVKITHDDKPIEGAQVSIIGTNSERVFGGKTNSQGEVTVGDLHPGDYWLRTEYARVSAGEQCFHVLNSPSRKAKKHLSYTWGELIPGVQTVAGRFVDSRLGTGGNPLWNLSHRVESPISGARITLENPFSKTTLSTASDSDGKFSFESVTSGTYVLHVDATSETADFAIDVSSDARFVRLALTSTQSAGGSCSGIQLDVTEPVR